MEGRESAGLSSEILGCPAQLETGSLAMVYSDVAYHGKLMFGPDMMREMAFFEDVAAICDLCHRKGSRSCSTPTATSWTSLRLWRRVGSTA